MIWARSHRLLSGAKINKDKQKTVLLNFVVQQGGFTCPLRVFLSDTVQTNLVSNQYQQAKRQAKKPVFMRVSEGSEIIPTRPLQKHLKQV